jgi:hypothetical protein
MNISLGKKNNDMNIRKTENASKMIGDLNILKRQYDIETSMGVNKGNHRWGPLMLGIPPRSAVWMINWFFFHGEVHV